MNYQITIDGDICRWGYSKQYMRQMLAQCKGKHVDMRISSLGGDLDHGLDMRQQLLDHGDVTVYLTGFVASAATVIAMGAKRICMSRYAMFLVHKCSNFIDAWGYYNADQMAKLIEDLEANKKENDKIDVVLAQMYANKCKKKVSEIIDVLKKGEWLTAEEALEYGFVDEIIEDDNGKVNFTDEMKAKFNAYSLPVEQFENAETADAPTQSLLTQILNAIKSLVAGKTASADVAPKNQTPEPEMEQITIYAAIMAALAVDSLSASADGSVTLSREQLETLNSALDKLNGDIATRDNTIAERDNKIAELSGKVDALEKMPADTTSQATEDTTSGHMSTEEVYNLIKDL